MRMTRLFEFYGNKDWNIVDFNSADVSKHNLSDISYAHNHESDPDEMGLSNYGACIQKEWDELKVHAAEKSKQRKKLLHVICIHIIGVKWI